MFRSAGVPRSDTRRALDHGGGGRESVASRKASPSSTVGGHLECFADLAHPRFADPSNSLCEQTHRHRLHRVQIHSALAGHGVFGWLHHDFASQSRMVVVHGATNTRRSRGIAASRESTTTGRRPISGGSHHHTSPRRGRSVIARRRFGRFEVAPLVGLVERMGRIRSRIFGIDLCGSMLRKKGCQRLIDEFGITRSGPRATSVVE